MADVFVSYSRADARFVTGLVDGLVEAGRDVWLDVLAIEDAEVFPEALRGAIEKCAGFVFVISPAAAASVHCRREVGFAEQYGKRIVPVVCTPTAGEALPTAVALRNWITPTGMADAVTRVGLALDRDIEHARAHAAWLRAAISWADHGEDRAYALRGAEQAAAQAWLDGAVTKDPAPTELHRRFVEAGRLPEGTVTLIAGELDGVVAAAEELGPRYGDVRVALDGQLRDVWRAHRGMELDREDERVMVAFASARDAVTAAASAQREISGTLLSVSLGVHTGMPLLRDGRYLGTDPQYAARLGAAASPGQSLLSATTFAAVDGNGAEELGEHALVDFPAPRRLYHLVVDGRGASDFPPPRTLRAARTNLPSAAGAMVGRESELAAVVASLRGSSRLVTLTGPGGSGKTRLAIACGHALQGAFADGVFLVALAPVSDPAGVEATIAAAVGAPAGELAAHLRGRSVLLVVDNMEHVLDAAGLLAGLLETAPALKLLATSQAPLRVGAEEVAPLGPLDPDAGAAVLFADRARAAGYEITDADGPVVAELCARLGGLPLAIELAAARAAHRGPARVLAALERGIDALGTGARDLPDRQRGLRAALDWTVALLDEPARRLFAALGAFSEAWTLEQLDAMLDDELDVWEAADALTDFSLMRARGDGRMTMAETVRTHAREQLVASGHEADYRRRHAELIAAEVAEIDLGHNFDFGAQIARARDLRAEIHAAVAFAAAGAPALHRRLVACLGYPLFHIGELTSYIDAIEVLAETEATADVDELSWRVWASLAIAVRSRGELHRAPAAALKGLALATGPRARVASAIRAAIFLGFNGQPQRGLEVIEQARADAEAAGDRRVMQAWEAQRAAQLLATGNLAQAEPLLAAIVGDRTRTDFSSMSAMSCWADCALLADDPAAALDRYARYLGSLPDRTSDNAMLQVHLISASFAALGHDPEAVELDDGLRAVGFVSSVLEDDHVGARSLRHVAAARRRIGAARAAEAADRDAEGLSRLALDLAAAALSREDGAQRAHPNVSSQS